VMAKERRPSPEDRTKAIRVALWGLADDLELGELAAMLEPLHPTNNTFPGEVLLGLAADAIEEAGATRERPLEFEGIRKRHLPEDRAHRTRGPQVENPLGTGDLATVHHQCGRSRIGWASWPRHTSAGSSRFRGQSA